MKLVYTTQDLAELSHLKNVLETHGIECFIRGQHLLGAVGGLPVQECWPELWVKDDEQFLKARARLNTMMIVNGKDSDDWICDECHEENPSCFSMCWHCGKLR